MQLWASVGEAVQEQELGHAKSEDPSGGHDLGQDLKQNRSWDVRTERQSPSGKFLKCTRNWICCLRAKTYVICLHGAIANIAFMLQSLKERARPKELLPSFRDKHLLLETSRHHKEDTPQREEWRTSWKRAPFCFATLHDCRCTGGADKQTAQAELQSARVSRPGSAHGVGRSWSDDCPGSAPAHRCSGIMQRVASPSQAEPSGL